MLTSTTVALAAAAVERVLTTVAEEADVDPVLAGLVDTTVEGVRVGVSVSMSDTMPPPESPPGVEPEPPPEPPPDEAAITIVTGLEGYDPLALVAVNVKVNEPAAVGVPDRTPVFPLSSSPSGTAPLVTLRDAPLAANVQL